MDIKKIPPSLLIALGLAGCGGDEEETGVGPCLSSTMSSTTGTGDTGQTDTEKDSLSMTGPDLTTGPCLDIATGCLQPPWTSSSGPCLSPPWTGTATATDTDTDTDTGGTDTDTDTDTGGTDTDTGGTGTTGGPCLSPPRVAPPDNGERRGAQSAVRGSVLDRILGDGVLPHDVAERLRKSFGRG